MVLVIFALSLQITPPTSQDSITTPSSDAVAACARRGGQLRPAGLSGYRTGGVCTHAFSDGGKACTDGSDCLSSRCWGSQMPTSKDAPVSGTCAPTDYPYGCQLIIVKGRVGSALCVD